MINRALAILFKYPTASPLDDFHVVDHLDGNGGVLQYWNVKDSTGALIPQPSESDMSSWWVSALKIQKIKEFDEKCNTVILAGFSSSCLGVSHQYKFDYEAQTNFNGQLVMFNADSTLTSVDWKTQDAGVLNHTKDQFVQLCKDGLNFKNAQIEHYRSLKDQVNAATTEDEINAINW